MNHDRMYSLGRYLETLSRQRPCAQLLGFHAYRYKFFVDNSPRGRHCRYARATLRMYVLDQERQELLQYLQAVPAPQSILDLLDEN